MTAVVLFVVSGIILSFFLKGKPENFFVAGQSLPLWVCHSIKCSIIPCWCLALLKENQHFCFTNMFTQVIVCTLASQAIDSNALLGASTLSYKFHYWDGVVLPLGLGLSLVNNAIFFARHINHDYALTLPDVLSKRSSKSWFRFSAVFHSSVSWLATWLVWGLSFHTPYPYPRREPYG